MYNIDQVDKNDLNKIFRICPGYIEPRMHENVHKLTQVPLDLFAPGTPLFTFLNDP